MIGTAIGIVFALIVLGVVWWAIQQLLIGDGGHSRGWIPVKGVFSDALKKRDRTQNQGN